MVKVRGRNSNRKTVKQTVKNGGKISGDDAARPAWVMVPGVSSSRLRPDSDQSRIWCRARPWLGCDSLNELTWVSFVVHWHLTIFFFFFFFFFFLSFREWFDKTVTEYRVWRKVHITAEEVRWSSDSRLIDIGERSYPNLMHRRPIRCSSATSKTVNGFGWSFFFAVWRRCARRQLRMNSVVLVESQGSCALVRIARLQKFDRRDNIIFRVHLNQLTRTHHWSSPRSKLAYKKLTRTRKLRKFPVTSGQGSKHRDWTASRWWARWRSQSSSCQHHVITWRGLIPADHEYLDSVAWPCHDCEVAPVWHHDVTNRRTCQFSAVCLTVFPFEFRPRTFTIGFYGKNSIISELMILECSFL